MLNPDFVARFDAGEIAWALDGALVPTTVVAQPKSARTPATIAIAEAVLAYLAGTPSTAEVAA
jgi:hypothetical protein